MILKVIATNVIEQFENKNYKPEEYTVDIKENNSINELRRKIGLENINISFDNYYITDSKIDIFLDSIIPFKINKTNNVEWECNFDEITIEEFIKTNKIDINKGIYLEYGYPQAGGPRFFKYSIRFME